MGKFREKCAQCGAVLKSKGDAKRHVAGLHDGFGLKLRSVHTVKNGKIVREL